MANWGRRLQLLGALILLVSPFFPWSQARVLGLWLGLPGLFLHGALVLASGLLLLLAWLLGLRVPGLALLLAGASAGAAAQDLHWVLTRTEYGLRRLQLTIADLNGVLSQLNLQPIDVFTREDSPWKYVGVGIHLALGGAAVVALGALLEAATTPGKKAWSVLLGFPRCRQCSARVDWKMAFCPGCGAGQARTVRACPVCQEPLKAGWQHCPSCGQRLERGEGLGVSKMGVVLE